MDDDDVSTKSITIFIIELGIWVLRASGNLGCNGGTFFDSGGLQQKMMMLHQFPLWRMFIFTPPSLPGDKGSAITKGPL